jgi:hypothetical protein
MLTRTVEAQLLATGRCGRLGHSAKRRPFASLPRPALVSLPLPKRAVPSAYARSESRSVDFVTDFKLPRNVNLCNSVICCACQ